MKRIALAAALGLLPGIAFAETNVAGELDKDYMRFYCVYESNLYSLGADMCSADGNIQICVYDEKESGRPFWKTETRRCDAGGEE
jgi:hypothetical protein